jgi:transposase
LGRWVNLDRQAPGDDGSVSETERGGPIRLPKENAELAMERDVLKRSAAPWVKEAMRR